MVVGVGWAICLLVVSDITVGVAAVMVDLVEEEAVDTGVEAAIVVVEAATEDSGFGKACDPLSLL